MGDYIRHISIANGSLKELETHLLISERLAYLKPSELQPVLELTDEIGRMLNSLMDKLKQKRS